MLQSISVHLPSIFVQCQRRGNAMTEVEQHNAALEKVTDFVEEKELNEDETKQLSTALSSLAGPAREVLTGEESRCVSLHIASICRSIAKKDTVRVDLQGKNRGSCGTFCHGQT